MTTIGPGPPRKKAAEAGEHTAARIEDKQIISQLPSDGKPAARGGDNGTQLISVRLSDVLPKPLEWLWHGWLPLGKVSLVAGDPGLGKSLITLDIAARVTRGTPWPNDRFGLNPSGGVVIISAEDDIEDTIVPRLIAAGGDLSRITAIPGVEFNRDGKRRRRCFSLEDDLPALEATLKALSDVRLVIIDPITAFTGKIDSHKNAEVRGLLAPLAELAGRYRVALLAVTHLNKATTMPAIYRTMGSLGWVAAARAVFAVIRHPHDRGLRLILPVKLNLSKNCGGLAYRVVGDGDNAPVVGWVEGPVNLEPDEAMTPRREGNAKTNPKAEAAEWLRQQLASGPRPSADLVEHAKQAGFSEKTLRRASRDVGVEPFKDPTQDGAWFWRLSTHSELATFEQSGISYPDAGIFPEDGHGKLGHLHESNTNSATTDEIGEDGQRVCGGEDGELANFDDSDEVEI